MKSMNFKEELNKLFWYIVAFSLLLLTNFQPWYFMWFTPFMIFQKSLKIQLINQMQIVTLFANSVLLFNSEGYIYGVPFFFMMIIGILFCIILSLNNKIKLIKSRGIVK